MHKIVGKSLLYIIMMQSVYLHCHVSISIKDADGIKTNTVAVGQPFFLDVSIHNVKGSVSTPSITGLERFAVNKTGSYMSSINGVSTTKYTYQVRIDTPGSYTVGPATVKTQQGDVSSDVVTITVSDSPGHSSFNNAKNSRNNAVKKVFLKVITDADNRTVFVGQEVKVSLRLYYQDDDISLLNIGQPNISSFTVQPSVGPTVSGTEVVDGVPYKYLQWTWSMYPNKSGKVVIPVYSADYEIPSHSNASMRPFFFFVSPQNNRKRIYSNSVTVLVNPLPPYDSDVHAVGEFKDFQATIYPAVVKAGEGMTLALDIRGFGNLGDIKRPSLVLPDGFHYYDSQVSTIEANSDDAYSTKRFEFVVQAVNPGSWTISKQSFVYFDVAKHAYVTLETAPLSVIIEPAENTMPIQSLDITKDESLQVAKAEVVDEDEVVKKNDSIPLRVSFIDGGEPNSVIIPWAFFVCLVISLCAYALKCLVHEKLVKQQWVKKIIVKKALWNAHKRVKTCVQAGDAASFYDIFIRLYSVLTETAYQNISSYDIELFLMKKGYNADEIQQWREFFLKITAASYGRAHNNINELSKMALIWLKYLNR